MPGMNAVGMNTAARMRAMATTGPDTSSIALRGGIVRGQALLHVVLDRLPPPQWRRPPRARWPARGRRATGVLIEKPSRGKIMKVPTSETGTARRRDEGRAESLEEDEDDDHHQDQTPRPAVFTISLIPLAHRQCGCRAAVNVLEVVRGKARLGLVPSASSRPSWFRWHWSRGADRSR